MSRDFDFRAVSAGVVFVFVLAAGAVGLLTWQDRTKAIEDGVRNARNIAVVLGGQIARSLQTIDIVLRDVEHRIEGTETGDPPLNLDARHMHDLLLERLRNLPQAFQMVVTDDRGQLIASTAAWPTPDINVADRDYFIELAAHPGDRLSMSQPFANRVNGESTIVLARRIDGPDRSFRGIVFVSIKKSYFEGIYRAVDSLPDQTFVLLRRDGAVLILYPDQFNSGAPITAVQPFLDAVRNGGGSFRVQRAFDGKVRWVASQPLADYPLVVNSGIPEEVLLRDWRVRAVAKIAVTAACLICALFLWWLMARQYGRLSASEASLAATSQELDAALNNMSQGLAMFDANAHLIVCNERYRQIHMLSAEQTRPGQSLRDIMTHRRERSGYPADVDAYVSEITGMISAGTFRTHEYHDTLGRTYAVRSNPFPDGGWVVTFDDVTERRAGEARIRLLAHNDILTGIANRPQFLDQIERAHDRLRATGQPFNVLMLDLDHFKNVNDSLGHAAGDALLQQAAKRLETSRRESDVLARLGGDEFAIIQLPMRELAPDQAADFMRRSASALAERIIEVIGQPFDIDGQTVTVGTSIGIAVAPFDGDEPDDLMKKADLALYKAKSDGRNGYAFFDRKLATLADERHQLEADLRAALTREEFTLHYQPQIDVVTRRLCGMEALVRWRHPRQGLITPDRFIALAEDTGLIGALGEWVLQAGCAEAARWPSHIKVAINISPAQFKRANLADVILCALIDSGLPPERLEIEITERVLLEDDVNYLAILHELKNLGISIALDDFGTGYSSLGYLTTFPFDKIKIDRSFTRDMLTRADCAAVASAVIKLGQSLGIATLAEGVESLDQYEALRAAGVNQAQGYLFGRPRPADQLAFEDAMDLRASYPPTVAAVG